MAEEEVVESGFEIRGEFYPLILDFDLGDPKLVTEVAGISWLEFLQGVAGDEWYGGVLSGLVAIAVWRKNPVWRRDKVALFVQRLPEREVNPVGIFEEAAEEVDEESPPVKAESPGKTDSATSANGSNSTPASPPVSESPVITGPLDSTIGAPV